MYDTRIVRIPSTGQSHFVELSSTSLFNQLAYVSLYLLHREKKKEDRGRTGGGGVVILAVWRGGTEAETDIQRQAALHDYPLSLLGNGDS
jgi:hypothetical protein